MHNNPALSIDALFFRQTPSANDIDLLFGLIHENGSFDGYWEVILGSLEVAFKTRAQGYLPPERQVVAYQDAHSAIMTFRKMMETRSLTPSSESRLHDVAKCDVRRFLYSEIKQVRLLAKYVTLLQNDQEHLFPEELLNEYPRFRPHKNSEKVPEFLCYFVNSDWFTDTVRGKTHSAQRKRSAPR